MRPAALRVACLQHVETVGVGQSWGPKATGGRCRSSGGGARGMGKKKREGGEKEKEKEKRKELLN